MTDSPRVLVLMSTYNGENYVADQIDSVLGQEDVNLTLWIHDDRSTDRTFSICQHYAATHPNVIAIQNELNLGVTNNFLNPLFEPSADGYDYYAFCDQDDVWLPPKLSRAAECFSKLPLNCPALYFSEIQDVDANLQNPPQELSIFRSCEDRYGVVLLRNWVPGCTMVFNAAFLQLLRKFPCKSLPVIHDTWVHRLARCCATVIPDYDHAYILRRLHGDNVAGETLSNFQSAEKFAKALRMSLAPTLHPQFRCAQLIAEHYSEEVRPEARPALQSLLDYRTSPSARCNIAFGMQFRMPTTSTRFANVVHTLFRRW